MANVNCSSLSLKWPRCNYKFNFFSPQVNIYDNHKGASEVILKSHVSLRFKSAGFTVTVQSITCVSALK